MQNCIVSQHAQVQMQNCKINQYAQGHNFISSLRCKVRRHSQVQIQSRVIGNLSARSGARFTRSLLQNLQQHSQVQDFASTHGCQNFLHAQVQGLVSTLRYKFVTATPANNTHLLASCSANPKQHNPSACRCKHKIA